MAKEANFVFLAIFSSGRPFFSVIFPGVQAVLLCRVPGPCFSRHVHWRQPCSLGWQEAQPCTERLLMNCAPCITRLFSGHLSRTGEGGFRYRISIPYRKSLFFTQNASENASRTPGACFLHGAHIPYRRRPSPVPNATGSPDVTYQNPSKHYHPTQRPDQALHNHPVTTAVNHPASTPCHHSYTPNPQHPQHTPTQNERSPD